jgi:hypothetical protein
MELSIPQDISFECPPGTFTGTFCEYRDCVKVTDQGEEKLVRLLFQPDDMSTDTKIVLVGKNFAPTLRKHSQLRNFLDLWLGSDFVTENSKGGKFQFESLHKRRGTLVVSHIENAGYSKPYVCLQSVLPLTTTANSHPDNGGDI